MIKIIRYCTGSAYLSGNDSEPTICSLRAHCRRYLKQNKLPNNAESKREYSHINAADCMGKDNLFNVPQNKELKHTPTL